MSWTLVSATLWIMAAAVAAVLTGAIISLGVKVMQSRTYDLMRSCEHLGLYDQLYAQVIADPATPESVKELLDRFDCGVMDRQVAMALAGDIFRRGKSWFEIDRHEHAGAFKDLDALEAHRPDLRKKIANVVAHGFAATMLRWVVSARALRLILVDPSRDPITPAEAVTRAVEHHHHRNGGPLPQPA